MAKKEEPKKEEEAKPEAHEAAPAKKGKSKLLIIVGAVVLLIAAAGVPMFLLGGSKPVDKAKEAEAAKPAEKESAVVPLDIFIVNLSESGAFLKVKMLLDCDNSILKKAQEDLAKKGGGGAAAGGEGKEGGGGLSGYLKFREPMIRDAVIRTLSAKRANEMLSLEGKEKLKEDLIESINEAIGLEEGAVQGIYFTEFIIQ